MLGISLDALTYGGLVLLACGTVLGQVETAADDAARASATQPTPAQLQAANAAVVTQAAGGVVFPADSQVRNVKAYGAVGDGKHDDTAAIQAAYDHTGLIYLPNGTYLITKQIKAPPRKGSASCRRILQGQSRDGVVLKLADRTPGFGDPAHPQAMLVTSWGVAQAFRNAVRDMTLDVGVGNPGAVALDFFASNQGCVDNVALRSSDPQYAGKTGLVLAGDNGPLLVKNLQVTGFDVGVLAGANALATMEHVTLTRQREVGMKVINKTFVRDLRSDNTVPAVRTGGQAFVLLGGELQGATTGTAIEIDSMALIRDLTVTGYAAAIKAKSGETPAGRVEEWTSLPPTRLGAGEPATLRLEVKDTPDIPWGDPAQWKNVADFKPTDVTGNNKGSGLKVNWTGAMQQAIDAGGDAVYLPHGPTYELSGEIHIRGKVRRVIGMENDIRPVATSPTPTFIVDEGAAPVVVIERFDSIYGKLKIVHRSPRTLVVRNMIVDEIILEPGAGDVFLEDVVTSFLDIHGQRVWARQLNQEHSYKPEENPPRPNTRNNGGTFWLFGLKTEQNRTKVWTSNGGRSEIVAFLLANRASNPQPMFVNDNATTTVCVVESVLRKAPFDVVLRQICGDQTLDLTHAQAPRRGEGVAVPLITSACPR